MGIDSTREYLNTGTEGLRRLPLEGLKETFANTVNVAPSISGRMGEMASLIGGAIAHLQEESTGINREAKMQLGSTSKAYAQVCASDADRDPSPQAKALWRQFDEVHYRTSVVVGPENQWGDSLHLVLSLKRMQEHLAALDAEMANYEQFRNGILNDIDQAEIARAQTIDQATTLNENL